MHCRVDIDCDNAAFTVGYGIEIARILREYADLVENVEQDAIGYTNLRDINGNKVGMGRIYGG